MQNKTAEKLKYFITIFVILTAWLVVPPVFSAAALAKPLITVNAKSNATEIFINGAPIELKLPVQMKNGAHVVRLKKKIFTAAGVKYHEWGGGSKIFVKLSHEQNTLILEIQKGRKEIKVKSGGGYVKITPMPELQYPDVFVPLEPLFELLGFSVSGAPQPVAQNVQKIEPQKIKPEMTKITPVEEKETEIAKTPVTPKMPETQIVPAEDSVPTKELKEEEMPVKKEEKKEEAPTEEKKENKVKVQWEPAAPQKTEAQSSPSAVSQSPAWQSSQKTSIPSQPGLGAPSLFTGAIGFSYQTMKNAAGTQFATIRQLSLAWKKPIRNNQSLTLSTTFNQQNATNAKQEAFAGSMIYNNPYFTLNLTQSRNKNATEGSNQTPSTNSQNNALNIALNVTAMKSLPLNLTFTRATADTQSGGKVTAENVTTAWSVAIAPKLSDRIALALNFASGNAQNKTGNAETKTESFGLNLNYALSKMFTLTSALQKTSALSLPQNPDAKSKSVSLSTSVGLSAKLLDNLSLGFSITNTAVENSTVQNTQKTSVSGLMTTLNYQPIQDVTLTAAFNVTDAKGANKTLTTTFATGYAPKGKTILVKGVNLTFQETQVKNKDGMLQNKTTEVGLSQNISPITELPFNTAFKLSKAQSFPVTQGASTSETQNQSVNITLPNRIGKKFTQSLGFQLTKTDSQAGAVPSVQTTAKTYLYNASRQETFSIGEKQLPAALSYAATLTSAPASDTAAHTLMLSLQYAISPSLAATYSLSRGTNKTETPTSLTTAATTTNNMGLTIKAGRLTGNGAFSLINSTGANTQTLNVTLAYAIFPKVSWNTSSNFTGTKASGKSASTFNLTSGFLYQF